MNVFLFWLSISLLLYTYVLYPILLKYLAKPTKPQPQTLKHWPDVDVILSAFNEELCITQRLENLLAQDYPGNLHILVASDGSSDNTAVLIKAFNDERITPYCFEENRGKIAVLNDLVANAKADYLVLTDANTEFVPDAIRQLILSFTPDIGAVCGELHLVTEGGNQNSDGLYWRYEQFLKRQESTLGALLGANGAIYAIKRKLYQPLAANTVVDDFCIVMNIKKQHYNIVYNEKAVAYEEVAPSLQDEFGRRVRIGLGNYRAFSSTLWALSPTQGLFSLCYWSHKVLRWFAPHLMLLALICNMLLINSPLYLTLFVGQITFYAIAVIGTYQINKGAKVSKLIQIISFFSSMNLALAFGFVRFIRNNERGGWKRTARQGEIK
ncbi:glycosyltransferase family 2 protein [Alishewanella sp. HL-SH05]|uniref:glycosyltransferase family 2 protein n=1 Tax=Alishewanella sp. HL-SH05 TaxID=3461145 RepID=UPI004041C4E7